MNRRLTTQRMTRLALLAAAAAVLGYMESIIAAPMMLPTGVKLGLANTVLLYSIYLLGPGYSLILMFLKVELTVLMSGNIASIAFSLGGGILSLSMMLLAKHLGRSNISIVGVSVIGAVFHNIGQLLVAAFILKTPGLMFYVFILMFAAVITGVITGLAGRQIVRVLKLPGSDPFGEKEGTGT